MRSWLRPVSETTNTPTQECSSPLGWLYHERNYEYWLEICKRTGLWDQSSISTRLRSARRKRRGSLRHGGQGSKSACDLCLYWTFSIDYYLVKEKPPVFTPGAFLLAFPFFVNVLQDTLPKSPSLGRFTEEIVIYCLWRNCLDECLEVSHTTSFLKESIF